MTLCSRLILLRLNGLEFNRLALGRPRIPRTPEYLEKVRLTKAAHSRKSYRSKKKALSPDENEVRLAKRREYCKQWYHQKVASLSPEELVEFRRKQSAQNYAWNLRNPDRVKAANRRHNLAKYKLTPEQFDQMLAEQGGVCESCREIPTGKKGFAVDHSHATGVVRGLLCGPCNTSLGLQKESAARLRSLADYIEKRKHL